jgi:hypothetical protein
MPKGPCNPFRSGHSSYGKRISIITNLLQLALQLGGEGLLYCEPDPVRRCIARLSRAYECAISRSFLVSLTKQHCAEIDEKSHQIESLRSTLQNKLREVKKAVPASGAVSHDRKESRQVRDFLDHCTYVRSSAQTMKRLNVALMSRRRRAHR